MDSDGVDANVLSGMLAMARLELSRDNRERALELTQQANELVPYMVGDVEDQLGVYELLAARWNQLGEPARAEPFIIQMLQLETGLPERRPVILGTRHLFYAKFLFEQRRFAQAAQHAREGLALYAEGVPPDDKELAYIRTLMQPVLRAGEQPLS